jgi:hypothetical protein
MDPERTNTATSLSLRHKKGAIEYSYKMSPAQILDQALAQGVPRSDRRREDVTRFHIICHARCIIEG